MNDSETYDEKETEQRLRKTLLAAFNMKPTQLKAIPRKRGKTQPPRARKGKQTQQATKRRA